MPSTSQPAVEARWRRPVGWRWCPAGCRARSPARPRRRRREGREGRPGPAAQVPPVVEQGRQRQQQQRAQALQIAVERNSPDAVERPAQCRATTPAAAAWSAPSGTASAVVAASRAPRAPYSAAVSQRPARPWKSRLPRLWIATATTTGPARERSPRLLGPAVPAESAVSAAASVAVEVVTEPSWEGCLKSGSRCRQGCPADGDRGRLVMHSGQMPVNPILRRTSPCSPSPPVQRCCSPWPRRTPTAPATAATPTACRCSGRRPVRSRPPGLTFTAPGTPTLVISGLGFRSGSPVVVQVGDSGNANSRSDEVGELRVSVEASTEANAPGTSVLATGRAPSGTTRVLVGAIPPRPRGVGPMDVVPWLVGGGLLGLGRHHDAAPPPRPGRAPVRLSAPSRGRHPPCRPAPAPTVERGC